MEKSSSIKNIAGALITFHVKVEKIKKDSTNPFFKSKYASLSNILDAINDPLNEAGLTFTQFPDGEHSLTSLLLHAASGEYIQGTFTMKPVKDDPQGQGSAITYARRYALSAILGLNIEDDDDANTATHGGRTPEQAVDNGKLWLNKATKDGHITEDWNKVTTALKAGTATIAQVETKFKLSKVIKSELLTLVNGKQYEPA